MSNRQYTPEQKAAYAKKMKDRRDKARQAGGNQRVRVPAQIKRQNAKIHIEDCTQEYLLALLNPYDSYGACIPSSFPLKSQKVHAFRRQTLTLGTTGVGFVAVRACAANDLVSMIYTTATSVGTSGTVLGSFTNLGGVAMTKLPYNNADFTAGNVQARLVSMGLRVMYMGREDARQGKISTVETPDHEDVTALAGSSLANFENLQRTRPPQDWVYINYSGPVRPQDIEFEADPYSLGPEYILCHFIEGAAGDIYDFEFYQNFEYIGRSAVGKTQNHTDTQGYNKVQQVMKTVASEKPIEPSQAPGIINQVVQAIGDNLPQIAGMGRQILGIANLDPSSILRQALSGLSTLSRGQPFAALTAAGTSGRPSTGMARMLTF